MLFISVYNKQGPLVTLQNMLLVRKYIIHAVYAAEAPDPLKVIQIISVQVFFIIQLWLVIISLVHF